MWPTWSPDLKEKFCVWSMLGIQVSKPASGSWYRIYPKKYAHGFCFAVLCCGYTLTDFPISIRLTSLALWQSNDYPSASKATLMNMDKYFMWIHYERLGNHNKAKHNKTVCIFLGIYCRLWKFISLQQQNITAWCYNLYCFFYNTNRSYKSIQYWYFATNMKFDCCNISAANHVFLHILFPLGQYKNAI